MFHSALKRAMTERGINQTRLAEMLGIGKPSISNWVSGKNEPHARIKQRIAELLDVDFDASVETEVAEPSVKNVPVKQAAMMLGKSQQFVRLSLQSGSAPFGFAVKGSGEKYDYHISPKKLSEYIGEVM